MELSVNVFVTLDGVMQGPGGAEEDTSGGFDRGGWIVPHFDEEVGPFVDGWFSRADAFLLGRSTYEMMQPYWSQVTEPDNDVATKLNTLPKHVVSRSLRSEDLTWQASTLVGGEDVLAEVRRLKEQPGRELQVHGSWELARALHRAGLVDVYRLLVFPVVVGAGKRLFDETGAPTSFTVESTAATTAGVTHLELRRGEDFRTGDFVVEDGRESVA